MSSLFILLVNLGISTNPVTQKYCIPLHTPSYSPAHNQCQLPGEKQPFAPQGLIAWKPFCLAEVKIQCTLGLYRSGSVGFIEMKAHTLKPLKYSIWMYYVKEEVTPICCCQCIVRHVYLLAGPHQQAGTCGQVRRISRGRIQKTLNSTREHPYHMVKIKKRSRIKWKKCIIFNWILYYNILCRLSKFSFI